MSEITYFPLYFLEVKIVQREIYYIDVVYKYPQINLIFKNK